MDTPNPDTPRKSFREQMAENNAKAKEGFAKLKADDEAARQASKQKLTEIKENAATSREASKAKYEERLSQTQRPAADAGEAGAKKKGRAAAIIISLAALAVLVAVIVGITGGSDEDEPEAAATSPAATATAEAEPSQEASPADPLAGLARSSGVSGLEVTREGGTLYAAFPLAEGLSSSTLAFSAQTATIDVLEAVDGTGVDYYEVFVQGSHPTQDEYGNTTDRTVLNAGYTSETVEKINFDGISPDGIWDLMDSGLVHPDLRG